MKKKLNLRGIKSSSEKEHHHDDGHNHDGESGGFKTYIPAIVSFTMLMIGIAFDYFDISFFKDWLRILW
jgi:Cd2+/Zn2+-exporting ATPase